MARRRPEGRFEDLVRAATRVFIASGGFQRTSLDEVAKALEVAKGTLYLYVESKEALFDLVIRSADQRAVTEPELPVKTPPPGSTLRFIEERLSLAALDDTVGPVLRGRRARPAAVELQILFDALYDAMVAHRTLIRLVNASAFDQPELAEIWFGGARGRMNTQLAAWLERRAKKGELRLLADHPVATARFFTESVHWFAVARSFDPRPDPIDDALARRTAEEALFRALEPSRD